MFIIHPDLNVKDREDLLREQCAKKEMRNYSHSLQQSEIDVETKNYAQDGILLDNTREELTNIKNEYAAKIKGIEDRMKERLEKIKFGKKQVSGILYGIPNHTENRMMYYDKFGELVESRDLLPDERQGGLFNKKPEGALSDLPLETAQVLQTITAENELNEFSHDEEGWEKMKDEQLQTKYGTTDIAVIRTMVYNEGEKKYEVPDTQAPKAPKAPRKPRSGNAGVTESAEETEERERLQRENAENNKK